MGGSGPVLGKQMYVNMIEAYDPEQDRFTVFPPTKFKYPLIGYMMATITLSENQAIILGGYNKKPYKETFFFDGESFTAGPELPNEVRFYAGRTTVWGQAGYCLFNAKGGIGALKFEMGNWKILSDFGHAPGQVYRASSHF